MKKFANPPLQFAHSLQQTDIENVASLVYLCDLDSDTKGVEIDKTHLRLNIMINERNFTLMVQSYFVELSSRMFSTLVLVDKTLAQFVQTNSISDCLAGKNIYNRKRLM